MQLTFFKNTFFILVFVIFSCGSQTTDRNKLISDDYLEDKSAENPLNLPKKEDKLDTKPKTSTVIAGDLNEVEKIRVGAEQPQKYFPAIVGKKVGIVANQTSVIIDDVISANDKITRVTTHLVDFLKDNSINITKVFAPEHGFRGTADAGEAIKDGIDSKTGIPLISLYGDNKKPTPAQLKNVEVMIFDIQDVGARFYTYISTLHYVMEACAEANIPLIILDRPNPNGHYIDGPILEMQYKSFVGMHPIPVVHGMTIGEYAQMINGEGWLENKMKCNITVIPSENYTHKMPYSLPIKPSPNLPNDQAINLYASLCFFEGTFVSAGRGTDKQFQIFGAPSLPKNLYTFNFTPRPNEGAKDPKFKGEVCFGKDLRLQPKLDKLHLEWLIEAYVANGKKTEFFNSFFTNLAGTKKLQEQIEQGYTYREIRKTWAAGLEDFSKTRAKYLIYE